MNFWNTIQVVTNPLPVSGTQMLVYKQQEPVGMILGQGNVAIDPNVYLFIFLYRRSGEL